LSNLKSTLKFELRFDNFLKVVKSEIKLDLDLTTF